MFYAVALLQVVICIGGVDRQRRIDSFRVLHCLCDGVGVGGVEGETPCSADAAAMARSARTLSADWAYSSQRGLFLDGSYEIHQLTPVERQCGDEVGHRRDGGAEAAFEAQQHTGRGIFDVENAEYLAVVRDRVQVGAAR